jgi:hypothetical protein
MILSLDMCSSLGIADWRIAARILGYLRLTEAALLRARYC